MINAFGSAPLLRVAVCRRVEDLEDRNAPGRYGLRTKTRYVLLLVFFFCTIFAGIERDHDLEKL